MVLCLLGSGGGSRARRPFFPFIAVHELKQRAKLILLKGFMLLSMF